ncbi:GDP-mannose 4,6-dehydratase [Pseudomonas sp. P7]|uniref:GDP-mannose 4,6-dehydratase n=1 Tax=Pseudomonas sivasensis TaxID=1880678 RepID=A0ABW8E0U1_9PSED|nr:MULTISPECIES: GDP-mannose 4,6-dehydratase [Pseudomonas]MBA2923998.1 GDP-mannose 4,6-dehydratase [Pseudomonas sivasensis]MBA2929183.1 GDP-mannose 4,6-dehydratase [Pseudomonas sivasensis]MCT4497207.1 GDP-mannose 4,6-dehydratase [Pseudomonas sivasensis]OYT76626.1 MAG: GDP-mannose 4,6-dehydratase [Pseudomonas sp. PGPPP2]PIB57471.1 NAD-dependent dehydratase [Pseudomonas sp. 2995-1]
MEYSEKTALICGVSGQDGAYLARLLLSKGYTVWGTSRDAQGSSFVNLKRLDIFPRVKLLSMVPEDFRSVFMALKRSQPDEVYYLAGQSSVGLSFEQPAETIQSITLGTLNMLEACRMTERPIRFYQAGSSECFGDTNGEPAAEGMAFHPRSPYAVAKSSAFWLVDNYREAYNLFACTGILFNHESPLRPSRFVTQKIVTTAKRIAAGSDERLTLGRLDIARDWGAASEYVDAMWRMLQCDEPSDFVIATGQTHTLETFVAEAFTQLGLDWKAYVDQSTEFFRPTDLLVSRACPAKAEQVLGWKAQSTMPDVITSMLNAI